MAFYYEYSDEELDSLVQDLSSKLSNSKGIQDTSQAYHNLKVLLESYQTEQKNRSQARPVDQKNAVFCETDPDMADVEFVPPKRNF